MKTSGSKVDDTYIAITPILLAIFLTIVGAGYYFNIRKGLPQWSPASVLMLALLFACFVGLSVRTTGVHMEAAYRQGRSGSWWMVISAAALFIITFLFSGYGVLSTAMLVLEGPPIVRENLEIATGSFAQLKSASAEALRIPELEALQQRVESGRKQLRTEILNPLDCGIGKQARKTIEDLAKDLPNFKEIATGTVVCSDTRKLATIFQMHSDQISSTLSDVEKRFNQPARDALKQRLGQAADVEIARLAVLHQRLAGVWQFATEFGLYEASVQELERATEIYAASYQELIGMVGRNRVQLASTIDISAVESIASPTQVIDLVISRFNRAGVYLVGALIIDLLTALVIATVVAKGREASEQSKEWETSEKSRSNMDKSKVTYIWNPIPHPNWPVS